MNDTMKALFDEWKNREHHQGSVFIEDGIVDQESWDASPCKILVLLKEAWCRGSDGNWDLIHGYVKKPSNDMSKNKTYWPMAHLAYGVSKVLRGEGIPPFPRGEHRQALFSALNSLAIVNIKKSHGKSYSNDEDLASYVAKDWDLIDRQIRQINPDVVICGRTWHLIKEQTGANLTWNRVYEVDGTPYINFWHPSNRANKEMKYYAICGIVERAVQNGLLDLPKLQRITSNKSQPTNYLKSAIQTFPVT